MGSESASQPACQAAAMRFWSLNRRALGFRICSTLGFRIQFLLVSESGGWFPNPRGLGFRIRGLLGFGIRKLVSESGSWFPNPEILGCRIQPLPGRGTPLKGFRTSLWGKGFIEYNDFFFPLHFVYFLLWSIEITVFLLYNHYFSFWSTEMICVE